MSDEVFKIKVDDSELESAIKAFKELEKIQKKFNAAKKGEKGKGKEAEKEVKAEKEKLSIFQRLVKLKRKERSEEDKHNREQEKRQKKMAKNVKSIATLSKMNAAIGFLGNFKNMAADIRSGRFTAGGLGMDYQTLKKAQKASKQLFGDESTLTGVMQSVQQAANSPDLQGALSTLGINTADFNGTAIEKMQKVFDAAAKLDFSGMGAEYLREAFQQVTGLDAFQFQGSKEQFKNVAGFINKQEVSNTDKAILTIAEKVEEIENKMVGVAGALIDKGLPILEKIKDGLASFVEKIKNVVEKIKKAINDVRFFFSNFKMMITHTFQQALDEFSLGFAKLISWIPGAGGVYDKQKEKHDLNEAIRRAEVEAARAAWELEQYGEVRTQNDGVVVYTGKNDADVTANDAIIYKDGKIVKLSEQDNIYATKGNPRNGGGGGVVKLDITIRDTMGHRLAQSIVALPGGVV